MAADTPLSDASTTTGQLKHLIQQFVDERDWGKYHNSKDVAVAINVEAGELLELFEWVREHDLPALEQDPDSVWQMLLEGTERARAEAAATMDLVRAAMKIDYYPKRG